MADNASEASDDSLQQPMVALLVLIKAILQQDDRGSKPSLPDRGRYLNKLAESNPRRSYEFRARAYALDAILAIGWRPMTCTLLERAASAMHRERLPLPSYGELRKDAMDRTLGGLPPAPYTIWRTPPAYASPSSAGPPPSMPL